MNDFDNLGAKVEPPSKLAHVVLRTSNFDNLRNFYKTFLGGHASYENPAISFITYDEEHHRIALINVPEIGPKDPMRNGLEHIAYTYPTLTSLLRAYRQRLANDIKPVWCVNHGPTTSLYYRDPDGNMLETQVDNFSDLEAANAYMASPDFNENPIGVDFDPEDHIKRLKAGESEESLMKRPQIGARGLDDVPLDIPKRK